MATAYLHVGKSIARDAESRVFDVLGEGVEPIRKLLLIPRKMTYSSE